MTALTNQIVELQSRVKTNLRLLPTSTDVNDLPFELDLQSVPKYIYTKPPTYNTSPMELYSPDLHLSIVLSFKRNPPLMHEILKQL